MMMLLDNIRNGTYDITMIKEPAEINNAMEEYITARVAALAKADGNFDDTSEYYRQAELEFQIAVANGDILKIHNGSIYAIEKTSILKSADDVESAFNQNRKYTNICK